MPIKTESKFLNELAKDCITYGLEERESVFRSRIQASLISSYKHRKARLGGTNIS